VINYKFAYLVGNILILVPVWLILFLVRRDLRKELMFLSLMGALMAFLTSSWFMKDYWIPVCIKFFGSCLEDILNGFVLVGTASVIYEVIFRRKHSNKKIGLYVYLIAFVIEISIFLIFIILIKYFSFNSIYSSVIAMAIFGLAIMLIRNDLIKDALFSGLFMGLIFIIGYPILTRIYPELFIRFWKLSNLSGIYLTGIPIEEIIWAFFEGLLVGPAYEFIAGIRYKR